MEWAGRVRSFRSINGLTQDQLAEKLGVDAKTVQRWESGRHRPSPKVRSTLLSEWPRHVASPSVASLSSLVESSARYAVLVDHNMMVVAASAPHRDQMMKLFRVSIYGQNIVDVIRSTTVQSADIRSDRLFDMIEQHFRKLIEVNGIQNATTAIIQTPLTLDGLTFELSQSVADVVSRTKSVPITGLAPGDFFMQC